MLFFLQGLDELPPEVTDLMSLAATVPPIAHVALTAILFIIGIVLLIIAVWRIVRGAHRLSSLHLAQGHVSKR